ncbi:uncharacterized protein STEHIDRAFT_130561 [Stereum hirsutum FP-91666 SS1]|uniref:uncharacterized protein n=1 Tax=Stereum hirsutum (strain FP-91666) TaxID=721885 RepID=UPI000440FF33|nr:uncharacterized protein STEHIDRAFT_130561 [Stereum hirsutum FP-91666 SS1]EIM87037.1 hypothetical protein STEHIDRAFT_130561 [Stereum hirsutum FP-91666 SS1]
MFKDTSDSPTIKWNMVLISLAMFIFATLDVAFGLVHNLDAFVYYKGNGGAVAEFSIVSNWVNVMKSADFLAQTSIGDAMLIYRCWIVYGKRWSIIIFPLVLWTGYVVGACITLRTESTFQHSALLSTSELIPLITSTLMLTLALNIIVTSAIVYRIWRVNQHSTAFETLPSSSSSTQPSRAFNSNGTRLSRIMRIIIESGLMYTISVVVSVIPYLAGNNSYYGISDCGISFNLIIIRVHNGTAFKSTAYAPQSTMDFHTTTARLERGLHITTMTMTTTANDGERQDGTPIELPMTPAGVEDDRKSWSILRRGTM